MWNSVSQMSIRHVIRSKMHLATDDNMQEDSKKDDTLSTPSEMRVGSQPSGTPSKTTTTPQLDPLFKAVTRMDEETANAKSISLPLWGELILDRSLFVLLPVAAFGIGGFSLSIYVAMNSGDAFTNAFVESDLAGLVQQSTPAENACRGLCSSQEEDLEGLRAFMSKLAK
jgi:hypothetical protein